MTRLLSESAVDTRRIGERLAGQLMAGDVLALRGDMGAGKSELARGIARGLGIREYVPSPSFTILQVHTSGRLPLYHFDWYRLSGAEELYELSMEEYLYGDGVSVVEWPERAEEALPGCHLRVTLTPWAEAGREARWIELTPMGGFREIGNLE